MRSNRSGPGLKRWPAIVGVMAGMALLACAGNENNARPSPTPASATQPATSTPSAPGSQADAQLRALASGLPAKQAHVVYTYTTTSDGATQQGTFTAFWKMPDWRFDYASAATSGTMLSLAKTTYHCTPESGGQCAQSPSLSDVPLPFISLFTDPQSLPDVTGGGPEGAGVARSTRIVAGQQADCFAGAGTAEVCFSSAGVLLSLSGSDGAGNEFDLDATSVGDAVTDDNLRPPYPVCNCGLP